MDEYGLKSMILRLKTENATDNPMSLASLAFKSLVFASLRFLSTYSLVKVYSRSGGQAGKGGSLRRTTYLGRRCHGSRRSADVHLDSAFTWPIPAILRDLIIVVVCDGFLKSILDFAFLLLRERNGYTYAHAHVREERARESRKQFSPERPKKRVQEAIPRHLRRVSSVDYDCLRREDTEDKDLAETESSECEITLFINFSLSLSLTRLLRLMSVNV